MLRRPVLPLSQQGLLGMLIVLLGALASDPAQAQWKWRDAKGQVQYSDRPPPASVPEKDVLQRPPGQQGPMVLVPLGAATAPTGAKAAASAAPSASAAAAGAASGNAPAAQRQRAADEARKRADEAAQRKSAEEAQARVRAENCQRARDQIRLLQDGGRIARMNAKGEREIIDDTQRAQEMERARAIQSSDCR